MNDLSLDSGTCAHAYEHNQNLGKNTWEMPNFQDYVQIGGRSLNWIYLKPS